MSVYMRDSPNSCFLKYSGLYSGLAELKYVGSVVVQGIEGDVFTLLFATFFDYFAFLPFVSLLNSLKVAMRKSLILSRGAKSNYALGNYTVLRIGKNSYRTRILLTEGIASKSILAKAALRRIYTSSYLSLQAPYASINTVLLGKFHSLLVCLPSVPLGSFT